MEGAQTGHRGTSMKQSPEKQEIVTWGLEPHSSITNSMSMRFLSAGLCLFISIIALQGLLGLTENKLSVCS